MEEKWMSIRSTEKKAKMGKVAGKGRLADCLNLHILEQEIKAKDREKRKSNKS